MYREIGAFDAKAKLSELLREVREGKRFTITVRGEPVADLVPSGSALQADRQAAAAALRRMKKVEGVSHEEIMGMIAEGRK